MKGHVFITGASGGLGLPVITELLANNWEATALVHSEKSRKRLDEAFPDAKNTPLQIIKGDVTAAEDVAKAVRQLEQIDALVHLAGGFKTADQLKDSSVEDFHSLISLNTLSAFLLLQQVLPVMEKQGRGSIVMIGAKPALYPMGKNAVYAASKAAMTNLMLSAAEEGRDKNIRANVIVPAVIDTPENRKWATEETHTEKWTSPKAIAETISWLIADSGKAVTGTVIPMFNKMKTF